MKRYYLCDVIGDGSDENPFRAALQDHVEAFSAIIPSGPDGRPLHSWCIVIAASKNHLNLKQISGVDQLPDFPLDGKMNAVNAASRAGLDAALQRRGIGVSTSNADGYRALIEQIGKQLHVNFSADSFDVSDV